ncbi:uncharacterized protein LOC119766664 [Culex quinquefasciatus]|uniref:uncharacterized protein LOC119766664 n=1 Tax=Culex quinquefasciatus TaxID=7176 RepID=UPI0018E2A06E|nr:uncharacterized protein LOC119766664 [Culex quinquefasciatus]
MPVPKWVPTPIDATMCVCAGLICLEPSVCAPALARANNNQLRILMEMMGRQMEEQEMQRAQQEQQQQQKVGLNFFDGSFVQNSDLETGVESLNVTQVDMFN